MKCLFHPSHFLYSCYHNPSSHSNNFPPISGLSPLQSILSIIVGLFFCSNGFYIILMVKTFNSFFISCEMKCKVFIWTFKILQSMGPISFSGPIFNPTGLTHVAYLSCLDLLFHYSSNCSVPISRRPIPLPTVTRHLDVSPQLNIICLLFKSLCKLLRLIQDTEHVDYAFSLFVQMLYILVRIGFSRIGSMTYSSLYPS